MITVCGRWETSQMPQELEWRMWRQLRGAFKIDQFLMTPIIPELQTTSRLMQFDTMEECLSLCHSPKIFLEPKGGKTLSSVHGILLNKNFTLVLGDTNMGNSHLVMWDDYSVRINTPSQTDFYGINAAAIALAYTEDQ